MNETTRIAFFVPSLNVGGAQRVTINLANGLASRGFHVDLLLSYRTGGLLDEVSNSVNIVDLRTPLLPVIGIGASIPAIVQYLRRENPRILFSAMTFANVISICAQNLSATETELVVVEHDTYGMENSRKQQYVSKVAGYLYPLSSQVFAVSEGVATSVTEKTMVGPTHVSVMYNPIRTTAIRHESQASIEHEWLQSAELDVILTVGRLEEQKDLPTLLRSFKRVYEQKSNTRLLIAGEGSKRQELQTLVAELDLSDVVSLPGFVENVYSYMDQADLFVLSSRHEGLPTVLIEALTCGCPVVSTDCPSGPSEILERGQYGSLVPVGDERALADAMLETLAEPPSPEKLRQRAEDFSMQAVIDDYEEFIFQHHARKTQSLQQ